METAPHPEVAIADRPAPLLRMTGISKSFPGVHALQDVSLEIYPGECLALMGENGAGKSTLMKVLSGIYAPEAGSIEIQGTPVTLTSPHQAQQLGISIIYQEFNLFPNMPVEENVFIGREPSKAGISIADIAAWPWIQVYAKRPPDFAAFPHLARWHAAIAERPAVKRACALRSKMTL